MFKLISLLGFAVVIAISGYELWAIDRQYGMEAEVRNEMAVYKPAPAEPSFAADDAAVSEAALPAAPDPSCSGSAASACFSIAAARQAVNKDIVGWLTVRDTEIDYPIVQGSDNDYYLRHDIYRNTAPAGSIFLDSGRRPDFTDRYAIIYGHSMKNKSMFGSLSYFTEPMYFNSHAAGTLYLGDRTCGLQIFACLVVRADDPVIYGTIASDEGQDGFLAYVRANARQFRDIPLSHTDRILGLSTCAYEFTDARLVVLARIQDYRYIKN